MPFRVVLFTQGGLGVDVALGLAALSSASLAGVYVEVPEPKRRGPVERLQRYVRYYGIRGALAEIPRSALARFGPGADAEEQDRDGLEQIARNAGARFLATKDLHADTVLDAVRDVSADLGLVVGTTILKPSLYNIPRLGSINIHQARVPQYQGSSALFWALYNGEREMGITVHQVAEKVDAGDVILETSVPLRYDFARYRGDYPAFARDYHEGIREASVQLLLDAVGQIAGGCEVRRPQDARMAVRRRIPTYSEKQQLRALLRQRHETETLAAGAPLRETT